MTAHKEDPMMDSVVDLASRVMTEADLPPPDTKRWVMRRKAEVVAGVRCGLISLEEACRRYTLSVEEFLSWQRLIDSHGVRGLRATRLQDYRQGEKATWPSEGLHGASVRSRSFRRSTVTVDPRRRPAFHRQSGAGLYPGSPLQPGRICRASIERGPS